MKIREILGEAPAVKKPAPVVNPTTPKKTTADPAPGTPPAAPASTPPAAPASTPPAAPAAGNPATKGTSGSTGGGVTSIGPVTQTTDAPASTPPAAPGTPPAASSGSSIGQAIAKGAEKTANVVAKGAQATHDVATKAAGALDKGTSMLQKMRQGYSNLNRGGKPAAAGDAFDGIDDNELKRILSKVSQGQQLDPREVSLMKRAHDRI